jgi:hypothetical protein
MTMFEPLRVGCVSVECLHLAYQCAGIVLEQTP